MTEKEARDIAQELMYVAPEFLVERIAEALMDAYMKGRGDAKGE